MLYFELVLVVLEGHYVVFVVAGGELPDAGGWD